MTSIRRFSRIRKPASIAERAPGSPAAGLFVRMFGVLLLASAFVAGVAAAATPCDNATHPGQCGWYDSSSLPPYVVDAILAKQGVLGSGNVLVLTSGDPGDPDSEISNDVGLAGCGTNPDGWQTYDCTLMDSFVPPQDSVVLALSSEWFEWYQTIFTDWTTIAGAGVPTVDVSINSWINNKVDIIPYGPWETGVVILTSLGADKMVNFRVADSGDHIYDTAIVVVPATWFTALNGSNTDPTLLCGNGALEPGEDCDDGNNFADDDCSTLCLGTQLPPSSPPPAATCGNLVYTWPNSTTAPYTCGSDLCQGFRCVVGNTISPACYAADQCAAACAGACVDVQTAALDCSTMCTVQPPATEPPPALPETCGSLVYEWADGTTMPYTCEDSCNGQRCLTGSTISPACYGAGECDATTCPDGECVNTPTDNCADLCSKGEKSATCTLAEKDQLRIAANQKGACLGSYEQCSGGGFWEIADGYYSPVPESCNGIDDDCNGVADDMFFTCGDPGLCQNTVNTCDPANPAVPVPCVTLTPPSPVEICNNGLDDDCEGSPDDGCQCGDNECMPGEDHIGCPNDCPAPDNGTACDDGNPCTSDDQWQGGTCVPGAAVDCGSGDACVVAGTCDPATGCSATKVTCDDGIACTDDTCDAVTGCSNVPVDFACDDSDPCTIDTCNVATGCTHSADLSCAGQDNDGDGFIGVGDGGTDCDDGNAAVHPGATETCNGVDDDCDGVVDGGFDVGSACQSLANDCGQTANGSNVCTIDGLGVECDAVSPPNPVGYSEACESAPNDCGTAAAGTIGCDGTCSATTPANPAGYGDACTSAANDCGGTAAGTLGCDGTCSATTPANPAGYGDVCESTANECGQTNGGTVLCDGSCSATVPAATDSDADGTADCLDGCPADADKIAAGACGCGVADSDANANGTADCLETARADLGITIEQLTDAPKAGRRLRYRLEVTNAGPDTVTPSGTVTVSVTGDVSELKLSRICTGTADAITCTTPAMAAGRSKRMAIVVTPAAGATVTVTASVSSPIVDPNAANQSATMVTTVP